LKALQTGFETGSTSFGQPFYVATSVPATSHHSGGVNVLMADGSVRFTSSNIGSPVWRAVGTRNGHELEASSF
jgi:prepilin-type processing-associated H-X9-DG protein